MVDSPLALQISTLGPPEVRLGQNLVIFPTRKTLALLIYLALENRLQPREHLSTLLWPEVGPDRSYASLRNTLSHLQSALRKASGQAQTSYLLVTHQALRLNPNADIQLDLQTVAQAYTLARSDRSSRSLPEGDGSLLALQSAAACHRGDFLAGFSLPDAQNFDDWAALQREVWHRRMGLILDRLSEIQFAGGEFAGAIEAASHWIALDAMNEVAYRRKMRAHFASGERGQALKTYETCRTILGAELGLELEPDTVALAERIRRQAPPPPSALSVLPRPAAPRPPRPDTSVAFLGSLFAGRTSEYQALLSSYEQSAAGQPQLVVLRGEAGIGKTRLAKKFLAWAGDQGAELLQGGSFESGSHLPLQPLVEALRLRIEQESSPHALLAEELWTPLSQILPELRPRSPASPQVVKQRRRLEDNLSQAQLFEPLVQLTLALAKRAPLVLFVDDLQWTDSATLDMLQYAIRRWSVRAAESTAATRVLLLLSLRSESLLPMTKLRPGPTTPNESPGLGQWLTRLMRELAPVHIQLEPLGESETVDMVQSILSPPDADFAKWLYDETHGHPFYLMETLKDLLERRVLQPKRRAEGQWTFALDAVHDLGQAVRVPSTVHTVVRSRLQRLSPNAFSLLAGGAILERQITFERLCAICNLNPDLALPALDELTSGRLLLETVQPGLSSAYAFANDMLRDVVYTEAGDARRRLFHRRALETLAEAGGSDALLAHHALAAGLPQAAFGHSLDAGREALHMAAMNEAIIHLESARQLVQESSLPEMPDKDDLQELYLMLVRAYALIGQPEKALALEAERETFL